MPLLRSLYLQDRQQKILNSNTVIDTQWMIVIGKK